MMPDLLSLTAVSSMVLDADLGRPVGWKYHGAVSSRGAWGARADIYTVRCASVRVSRGYEIDWRGRRVAPARVHAPVRVAAPETSSLLASGKGCERRPSLGPTPSGAVPTASNASCNRPTGGPPASMYTKGRPGPWFGSCELAYALVSPVSSD